MSDKKIQRKLSIFQKMFLTMMLVSVIPLSTIWVVSTNTSTYQINRHIDSQLSGVVTYLASYVDSWVDMNKRMLLQNAASNDIQSMDSTIQSQALALITRFYKWNYLAFTVDTKGNNIGRSDGKPLKFYGDRSYVKQIFSGEQFGKQVLIGKTSGKPAFVLSTAIQDNRQKIKGVLAIAMSITDLSERITNTRIGRSGKAFLMDNDGKIIAHQSPEYTESRKDFSSHATFKASMQGQHSVEYVDEEGKKVIAYLKTTSDGWIMVAQLDHDEAYLAIQQSNNDAMILLSITIVLVTIVAFLLARRLSNPIRNLTRVANDISMGSLTEEIREVGRTDELGALAQSIDRLGTSVKLAIKKLSEQNTDMANKTDKT